MELALFARNVRFSAAPLSSCVFCGKTEEEIEVGEEFGEEPASGGRQRRSRLSRVFLIAHQYGLHAQCLS